MTEDVHFSADGFGLSRGRLRERAVTALMGGLGHVESCEVSGIEVSVPLKIFSRPIHVAIASLDVALNAEALTMPPSEARARASALYGGREYEEPLVSPPAPPPPPLPAAAKAAGHPPSSSSSAYSILGRAIDAATLRVERCRVALRPRRASAPSEEVTLEVGTERFGAISTEPV